MITLKVLKNIKDSSVKRVREVGELFEVSTERLDEMRKSLGSKFDSYFLLVKGTNTKKSKK